MSQTGMAAIGDPLPRVDGNAKDTGAAKYSAEFRLPGLAYASLVMSTIPAGDFQYGYCQGAACPRRSGRPHVAVDADLGMSRVRRVVAVNDVGRIVNRQTARSQFYRWNRLGDLFGAS